MLIKYGRMPRIKKATAVLILILSIGTLFSFFINLIKY